jgi:parallel beta-helix repeat protein
MDDTGQDKEDYCMARPLLKISAVLALLVLAALFAEASPAPAAYEPASPSADVCGPIGSNTTWTAANSPYVVTCDVTVNAGVTLTVEPGVVVKFLNTSMTLFVEGTLLADGTETDKIYFTSYADDVGGDTNGDGSASSPAPGQWDAIRYSASSSGNLLDHSVVRYGGRWGAPNIHSDTASLTIRNSTIAYAGGRGIYLDNAIPNEISNTSFLDNAGEAIFANNLNNNGESTSLAGSTASGNGLNGLVVTGNLSGVPVWQSGELFPIIVRGSLTINETAQLTLSPGTILKMETWSVNIYVNGSLIAGGTETEKTIFTSLADDTVGGDTNGDGGASSPGPGNWSSIRFTGTSTDSLLDHTVVRYGAGSNSEIVYIATSAVTVTNSTISHSGDRAMYLDGGAPLIKDNTISDAPIGIRVTNGCTATLEGNLIVNNSSHGVLSEGGSTPTLRANTLAGNGSHGVINIDAAVWVDARGNWWNSASGPFHPTLNPEGTGDAASDHVLFSPWLQEPPETGEALNQVNVTLHGPSTVSPGETVSYAVGYANWSDTMVEDAVLVLRLPTTASYVDSSGGGIYWPERHEVFWQLGDLSPQQEDLLAAQFRYLWGLPTDTPNLATLLLWGTNLDESGLDVQSYLDFVPHEVISRTQLTPAELAAERLAYPDLDVFCSQAEDESMLFGLAQQLEWSDGPTSVEVIYMRPDEDKITIIRREGDQVSASIYNRGTYTIKHPYGGVFLDLRTYEMDLFGDWDPTGGGGLLPFAGESYETPRTRFENCLLLNLSTDDIDRIGRLGNELNEGSHCQKCVYQGENCFDCAYDMGIEYYRERAYDAVYTCGREVQIHPDKWVCSENLFSCFLSLPLAWESECDLDTGTYASLPNLIPWAYDPSVDVCVNGTPSQGGGVYVKPEECEPYVVEPPLLPSLLPQLNTCTSSYPSVTPARDPNAKYGPAGDVLPGQVLTYTVECENEGAGTAYGVYIADELGEHFDLDSLTVNDGGERISGTNLLWWDIGELAPKGEPGSTATVSFTVRLKDDLPSGTVIANDATVYFPSVPEETPTNAVVNVVQPLVALPQSLETEAGQPVAITLEGVDAVGSPLTYAVVEDPLYGELSGVAPTLVYTAMTTVTGLDRFTFQVSNGITDSRPAEVTIQVHPWSGDTAAPEIKWTDPGDGAVIEDFGASPVFTDAVGPAYWPYVFARFSEVVSATTVTTDSVRLVDQDGRAISATVTYDTMFDEAWMVLRTPLQAATRYTATVLQGVRDLMGNPLAGDYSWSFSTQSYQVYLPAVLKP